MSPYSLSPLPKLYQSQSPGRLSFPPQVLFKGRGSLWPSTPSALLPKFRLPLLTPPPSHPHPTPPPPPGAQGRLGAGQGLLSSPTDCAYLLPGESASDRPQGELARLPAATSADGGGGEETGVLTAARSGQGGRSRLGRLLVQPRWRWLCRRGEFAVTPQPQASCPQRGGALKSQALPPPPFLPPPRDRAGSAFPGLPLHPGSSPLT